MTNPARSIDEAGLERLLGELKGRGYRLIGPTVRDGAIVQAPIGGIDDLPRGWSDRQEAGRYRLHRRGDDALFGYVVGPHSPKRFLFPPRQTAFRVRRDGGTLVFEAPEPQAQPTAYIGLRSCELHALAIQDRIFTGGDYVDRGYRARRRAAFLVAVNCVEPGGTCFCASMGTGPRVQDGCDMELTELLTPDTHSFVVAAHSEAGAAVLDALDAAEATAAEKATVDRLMQQAAGAMGRTMETGDMRALLYGEREHARWDEVAARCLSCGSCTSVCPTCFCSTSEDRAGLDGSEAEQVRRWDSCFNGEFSYVVGGSIRDSTRGRYRQWLTHKLASWHDQFGSSGCVGCGRCITWCPVGIDITEEVRAIAGRQVGGGHGQG